MPDHLDAKVFEASGTTLKLIYQQSAQNLQRAFCNTTQEVVTPLLGIETPYGIWHQNGVCNLFTL